MKARRWIPHPLLSLCLLLVWLLLMNDLSLGHFLLGALLGWAIPLLTQVFWINPPKVDKPFKLCLFPGTVSADLSDDHKTLLVHGLDVPDAEALVAEIKQRYEAPLLEVFTCSTT